MSFEAPDEGKVISKVLDELVREVIALRLKEELREKVTKVANEAVEKVKVTILVGLLGIFAVLVCLAIWSWR